MDLCDMYNKVTASIPAPDRLPLLGICKEVAPTSTAETDEQLGVAEFQNKYFPGADLYLNEGREFYEALGNRKISLPIGQMLLNPLKVWREFKNLGERIKEKNIDGNMVGEGAVLGGVLVISPEGEVKYTYLEETGKQLPVEEIRSAMEALQSPQPAATL